MGSWPHTGRSAAVLLSFTLIGKSEKYYYFRFLPDENNNICNRGKHSVVFLDFEILRGVIQSYPTDTQSSISLSERPSISYQQIFKFFYALFVDNYCRVHYNIITQIDADVLRIRVSHYAKRPITFHFIGDEYFFSYSEKRLGTHTFNGFRRTPNYFVGRRFFSTTIVFVCFAWSVDV